MMKIVQKTGRFYTGIIMKNIGIFIFIGLLSVVFQPDGWIPNATMYEISQFAYNYALPSMIAFAGGSRIGGHEGGILSVMAICGLLIHSPETGIFGAMLCGPVCGFLWKKEQKLLEDSAFAQLQMLMKNLLLGITGGILAAATYYFLTGATDMVSTVLEYVIRFLVEHRLIAALNILIEPAKVFFFNNLLNHGVFVPLGMSQAEQGGRSLLFLLETNPGPGLGMILGLLFCDRDNVERRSELMAVAVTEAIGGVHEVYFPIVLQNLILLFPLICGGMAGTVWFSVFQCGTAGVVSPGSVITILILSDPKRMLATGAGILVSAGVAGALTILCTRRRQFNRMEEKEEENMKNSREEKSIDYQHLQKIGFVCDGGMGSSAMGAALFRRSLAARGIQGVEVKAYAIDLIPDDLDLIVCQQDFYQLNQEIQSLNCHVISGFTVKEEYEKLTDKLI